MVVKRLSPPTVEAGGMCRVYELVRDGVSCLVVDSVELHVALGITDQRHRRWIRSRIDENLLGDNEAFERTRHHVLSSVVGAGGFRPTSGRNSEGGGFRPDVGRNSEGDEFRPAERCRSVLGTGTLRKLGRPQKRYLIRLPAAMTLASMERTLSGLSIRRYLASVYDQASTNGPPPTRDRLEALVSRPC